MTDPITTYGLHKLIHDQSARNVELIVEAAEANRAARQAVADAQQLATRQRILANGPSANSSATGKLLRMEQRHKETLLALDASMRKMNEEIKLKDDLILDWMRSNESFKRLAMKYAKAQGVSGEQFDSDLKIEQANANEVIPKSEAVVAAPVEKVQTMGNYLQEQRLLRQQAQKK